jgi:beta-galactosidase/beta-glucuronidase
LTVPGKSPDRKNTLFGIRELTTEGSQFLLNGQPLFLRGTHDGG